MVSRKLSYLVVVLAGIFAMHAIAYALAHPDPVMRAVALDGHEYQSLFAYFLAPLTALAVSGLALKHAREASLQITMSRLSIHLAAGFLVVEAGERLGGGVVTMVTEPAVWVGLGLVVPVAAAFAAFVKIAVEVARVLVGSGRSARPGRRATLIWTLIESTVVDRLAHLTGLSLRGPPHRFVTAP